MVQTDFETGNWFKSFDRRTVMRNAACVLPWIVSTCANFVTHFSFRAEGVKWTTDQYISIVIEAGMHWTFISCQLPIHPTAITAIHPVARRHSCLS